MRAIIDRFTRAFVRSMPRIASEFAMTTRAHHPSSLSCRGWVCAAVALAMLCSVATLHAAPLREVYRLRERGEWKEFEVAHDEVQRSRSAKRATTELPTASPSAVPA